MWRPSVEPKNQPGAWGFNRELGDDTLTVTYGANIARYMRGNKGRLRLLPFKRQAPSSFPRPVIAGGARVYYRQYQEPAGFTMITNSATVSGTAEALLWPFQFTGIPAQALVPGQQVQIVAYGVGTTPASAATTATINPRWGTTTAGTTLGISGASGTVIASQTNVPWVLNFIVTVRTVSDTATSSTVVGAGTIDSVALGTAANNPGTLVMGGTAATVDTVSAEAIIFGITLGGSAGWTMTTQGIALEVLN